MMAGLGCTADMYGSLTLRARIDGGALCSTSAQLEVKTQDCGSSLPPSVNPTPTAARRTDRPSQILPKSILRQQQPACGDSGWRLTVSTIHPTQHEPHKSYLPPPILVCHVTCSCVIPIHQLARAGCLNEYIGYRACMAHRTDLS